MQRSFSLTLAALAAAFVLALPSQANAQYRGSYGSGFSISFGSGYGYAPACPPVYHAPPAWNCAPVYHAPVYHRPVYHRPVYRPSYRYRSFRSGCW